MFSLLLLPLSLCLGSFVFVVNFCRIFQLFWLCCCCCCCLTLLLLLLFYCLSLTRCCLRRSQRILNVCQRCRFVQRYLLQTGVWGPGRALRIGSMCYARLFNRYWLPAVDTDWRPLPFAIAVAVAAPLTSSSSLPYAVRLASLASARERQSQSASTWERAFAESVFVLVLGALCLPACFGIEFSSAELNWVRCCCCSCCCLCHDRVLMLRANAVAAPPTHCNPKQRQRKKTTTSSRSSKSSANGDWRRAPSSGGVDFLLPG